MVIDNTKIPEKGERRTAMPVGHSQFEEEKDRFAGTEVLCLQFYADPENPLLDESEQRGHGYVIVGGSDKRINIWNIRTYDHVAQFCGHMDSITCMAIDANILFTGSDDMSIGIWELQNCYNVGFLHGHKDSKQHSILIFICRYPRHDSFARKRSLALLCL